MRTYRELFQAPEFTPLFLTSALQVAGTTVSGIGTNVKAKMATVAHAASFRPGSSGVSASIVSG